VIYYDGVIVHLEDLEIQGDTVAVTVNQERHEMEEGDSFMIKGHPFRFAESRETRGTVRAEFIYG